MKSRVIYITGYGRSGSTMVDMALGMHPEIFGAGELSTMCRHVWTMNEFCACGSQIRDCTIWGPVMTRWTKEYDPKVHLALQRAIEPLYAPARLIGGGKLRNFLEQSRAMFSIIRDETDTPIILDSSKAPGRALALARDPNIDLRVIHLVRDARAVAHSMSRAKPINKAAGIQKEIVPRSALRTALRWRMYNNAAERLRKLLAADHFLRVRYEDFARDPAREMTRISSTIGVDLSVISKTLAEGGPVLPAHQMAGSRIRMKGPTVLQYDAAWELEMSKAERRQVELVVGDLLRRYLYVA